MKKNLPQIFLALCVIIFFLSSLLSVKNQMTELLVKGIMVLGGIVSFLFIIVNTKISRTYKVILSIILCCCAGVYHWSMPYLFRVSVKLYLYQNETDLMEINNLLLSKNSDLSLHGERLFDKKNVLNESEKSRLIELEKNTDNYWITKTGEEIGYELYGFLDNRCGIIYSRKPKTEVCEECEEISENWYLHFFPYY